jgi:hypothetical protein
MPDDSLPVGTVLPAGGPTPPSTSDKAVSAAVWGAVPAVLALLATWLESAPNTIPSVDPQVWTVLALLLTVATPIVSAIAAQRKGNTLKQPVQITAAP